jgi:hypothetical protein
MVDEGEQDRLTLLPEMAACSYGPNQSGDPETDACDEGDGGKEVPRPFGRSGSITAQASSLSHYDPLMLYSAKHAANQDMRSTT